LEHGSYAFGAWFLRSELGSNSFFFEQRRRTRVHNAFFKINRTKMTQFTNMYLDQHVQLSFDHHGGTVEDKAVRLLQRTFAQDLAEGNISMKNLKLSAFFLAGRVGEHEVISGLLSAAYLADGSDYWRRGISTGCRTETSEVHEQ
jgi:hypothetical protein